MKAVLTTIIIVFGLMALTSCNPRGLVQTQSGFTISKHQRKIQRSMHGSAKIVIKHRPHKRKSSLDKAPTLKREGKDAYNERKDGLR